MTQLANQPQVRDGARNGRPLRVLVIHEACPEFDRNGADQRMMQVLGELRARGHAVTFLARNGVNRDRYAAALERLGIAVFAHDAARIGYLGLDAVPAWDFLKVLEDGQFDLAILFLWFWTGISVPEHYLDEIRRHAPRTVITVITEDRHGQRELRLAQVSGRWSDWERAQDYGERELEIYRAADLTLTISEEDRQGLLAAAPELAADVLPYDAEALVPAAGALARCDFGEREGFLFLGNFDNHANRDGITWFMNHVWPYIRRAMPEARLHLAGHNMPVTFAANVLGVVGHGYVADLAELFTRHRVFVSPVRYGTGAKTKNVNALAHGIPLVTSTIGAEGLNLHHEREALIADRPEQFAEAALRVYKDAALWQKLAERGPLHVRREFSHARLVEALARHLERVRRVIPKPYDAQHRWSFLAPDSRFPEVLNRQPAHERTPLRIFANLRLAEAFIAQKQPAEARRQLRHVFSFLRDRIPQTPFFVHLFERMIACYRQLGDADGAARFLQELDGDRRLAPATKDSSAAARPERDRKAKTRHGESRPVISVVIPTCNRAETLVACLEALNQQTLAPEAFEAVVVDDGSTDKTQDACRNFASRFRLRFHRQSNAGAGAARRAAVEMARGEYTLLFNDDTIASPRLLEEHLHVQRAHGTERLAVLGDFRYPPAARSRALTHFLNTQPFLFPQMGLTSGPHDKNSYFIASNLSVRRDAVLSVGSFDAHLRVAEDTELGVRLRKAGYRVLYHPAAWAWHDHLNFTIADLLCRARQYGRAQLRLLRKHPHLLGEGTGPFGQLREDDLLRLRAQVEAERHEVARAVEALAIFDQLDFLPFFSRPSNGRTAADEVMELFGQAVPRVFYHHLYAAFLEAWGETSQPPVHNPARNAPSEVCV